MGCGKNWGKRVGFALENRVGTGVYNNLFDNLP